MSEEKKIIDRINRSYDDNTQYVEASAKDWNYIVHSIRKLHEEIEEKSTIIMAGAEKVKQLEKEIQRLEKDNDTLSELVIVNEDKVIKELDLISKDKIREKIKKYDKWILEGGDYTESLEAQRYALNELLEEN